MNANAIEANIISLANRPEDTMSMPPKAMRAPNNTGVKTGMLLAILIGLLVIGSLYPYVVPKI